MPQTPRIVFVTDGGLLRPTLFAMWGTVRHLTGAGEVHLWGDRLTATDWAAAARVAATNPRISFHPLELAPETLDGVVVQAKHISAATMGRLHIPAKMTGRVLYIDGDTQVTGDLAPLFALDLQGKPIAAVRDYVVAGWYASGQATQPKRAAQIAALREVMGTSDPARYINAGVLLLDTDAIRAEPALNQAMQDVERASRYALGDQDHVNHVFRDRIHLLNPAYNVSWGRAATQRGFSRVLGGDATECARLPAAILHFHGPRKPWKNRRYDLWSQRARAVLAYRRSMRQFEAAFPDLAYGQP